MAKREPEPPIAGAIKTALGGRLRTLREARDWGIKEVAGHLGIGYHRLEKYEIGKNEPPLYLLIYLADLYNVSIDFLIRGKRHEAKIAQFPKRSRL